MNWIKIILGIREGTNFQAVTVINGNISIPFDIKRGRRQGDPISGYVFIMVMEILALMLAKGNLKPYKTAYGQDHLLDIYADDLTIYLKYDNKNN